MRKWQIRARSSSSEVRDFLLKGPISDYAPIVEARFRAEHPGWEPAAFWWFDEGGLDHSVVAPWKTDVESPYFPSDFRQPDGESGRRW